MVPVRLFDYSSKLWDCKVLVRRDLDHVNILEDVLPDVSSCAIRAIDEQEFLLENGIGERGVEVLEIIASRDQFAAGGKNARTGNLTCIDRVAQFGIAIDPGMAQVANCSDAALQIFPRHLSSDEGPLSGRFHDVQQKPGRKDRVKVARHLLFGRNDDVEKDVRMAVDQSRQ